MTNNLRHESIFLRSPNIEDGLELNRLVSQCPPLDPNSVYCNLLQCGHFASTSVAAFAKDELIGFASGYRKPDSPKTLFVWQVVVAEKARGMGLASKMLTHILQRPTSVGITHIETTITPDNHSSWSLFQKFASHLNTDLTTSDWLNKDLHFGGLHESESLVRIGPLPQLSDC